MINEQITDADMDNIVGIGNPNASTPEGGQILAGINALEAYLQTNNIIASNAPYSAFTLTAVQWATQSLLGANLDAAATASLGKTADLGINNMNDIDMEFIIPPEFVDNTSFTPA